MNSVQSKTIEPSGNKQPINIENMGLTWYKEEVRRTICKRKEYEAQTTDSIHYTLYFYGSHLSILVPAEFQ